MIIRSYTQGDESAIMELDARELPSQWNPRTLENWYWKFTDTNPNGHSLIWIAEHQGKMIGHFAAVPYLLKVLDEEVKASHTIGALVDKRYKKRGLLKFVGDRLMEELIQKQIVYTWGFPNKLAYEFEKVALGYIDLLNFDQWKALRQDMVHTPANPAIRPVRQFDTPFDQLWETCAPDYPVAIKRSSQYLEWRFLQRPDWDYFPFALYDNNQLKGYVVLKLYREEKILRGHIIDIFAQRKDKETFSQLIDHSLSFLIEKAVDEVTVWIWGNETVEELMADKGFQRIPANIPLILRVNNELRYNKEVTDNRNWFFTMGDSTEIF